MKKKRFQLGGSFYEIPEGEISSFLQENPKAIEVKFYDIKGSQFNIPISDVDSFEIDMGLKKKDGGVPSPDGGEAGISVPPSGFEGLKPVKTKVSIKEREVAPPIDLEGDPIKAAASKVTDLPKLLERQQRAAISTTGVEKPIEVAREVEKERKVERVETAKAKKLLDTTTKAFQQDAGLSAEFLMRAGKLSSPEQVNVLSKEQLIELADPNNETQRLAVNTLLDQKDINQAISSAKDLEEAAVLYAGAKDPQVARQIDITSLTVPSNLQEVLSGTGKRRMAPTQDIFAEATRGRMLYQMLTNPVAVSEIQKNPKLNQELKDAVPMLLEKYPDFGKMYLGQRISQKMEDMGTNNAILNIVTPEETDRAVEALVGEGKMSQREKQFYEQNLRGEGGLTDFGRKILGRQLYDTPGLVESTLGGAVQGVMALGRGSAELTGLRQGLLGESETVARDLAERDLRTNVSPKNTLNQISKFGGEFLGQSLSIGAGGKALNAIKAVKGIPLASGIVGGLQAYANYLPDARSKFPGDEIKQRGYATILASLEGLTENIFRDSKVVDGLMGRMRPEVKKVIEDFSSKKISAEAARQTLQGQIKKTLLELPEAAKFYAKGVAENTAEEVAAQLGQQITSGVFENKSIDDWINGQELFDTARQALLGSAFVAGLSARADMAKNRGITAKMIYGMAENPEYWTYKIQEAAALDPDFAAEAEDKLSNLGYASRIFGEIQDSNMTEKQKIKYLMDALDAKVKTQQAQSITDPVLKKKLEGEVAAVQKEQADLLDNIDDGTIEGDFSDEILPEEKEAVVEVKGVEEVTPEPAPQVPAAPEIGADIQNKTESKILLPVDEINSLRQQAKTDLATGRAIELERKLSKEGIKEPLVISYYPNEGKAVLTDGHNRLDVATDMGAKNLPIRIVELYGDAPSNAKDWNPPKSYFEGVGEVAPEVPAAPVKEVPPISKKGMADVGGLKTPDVSQVPAAPEKLIIEVKSPKEVKQGDTIVWRGEDFIVDEVNPKGGFNLKNVKDPTWTVKDARITDEEFQGKRGEVEAAPETKEEIIKKYPELKNTKAVDNEGKPLLLYHGGVKFDDFKPSQKKEDKGIYFTDNKELALFFAHQAELVERDKRGDDYSDIPEKLLKTGEPFPEKYFKYAKIHKAYLDMKNPTVVDAIDAPSIPKNYEPNTDGFIAKSTGDFGYKGGQYVVFDPKQIKKVISELPPTQLKPEEYAVQEPTTGEIPVQPEARVSKEVEEGVPPTRPPKAPEKGEAEGEEREMTGISNEEAEKMRLAMALPLFERPEPETFEQLNDKANEEIRKGYDIGKLLDKLEKNIPPTSLEEVILAKYGATLADKFEKTKDEQALKDYERLTNITNKIGTLTARALNARKVLVPKEDTLADFFILEKEETGVDELTEEQKATVTKEYEEIKAAKEALEKKIEELQEENARILAGEVISEERKRAKKGKKTDKEFTEERKQIIQDIREKLKEAREQSKSTVVPYANELITIAPDVAKLVKNLVEQGVVKLEDIVNEIHESLKGDIEDLTKKDVRDLIAGEYTKKKKSRSQIAAQIVDLKNEAKLLVQLEKLEAGEIPKDPIKKVERNREIKKLRDRIKEHPISKAIEEKRKAETKVNNLQKELDNLRQKIVKERAVPVEDTPEVKELKEQIFEAKKNLGLIKSKAPKPEEVKTPEQKKVERLQKELEDLKKGITKRRSTPIEDTPEIKKLKEQIKEEKEKLGVTIKDEMASAKKRIAAQIAKLEKDIKEGNFDKKPEKREVPLDREGKELQRKLIGLKKEREIRRLKNEYEKRNKAEKVRDKLLEIANIPRSLMASTDFSAPLNQAIVATIAYPDLARKAAEQMIKATASQGAFDEWFDDLKSDPRYDLMKELKLRISDPNSPFLTAKEEAFMSGYAEQIPVVGKLVKASERAYVQYLNKLRVDLFNRFIDKFEEQGKTYQNNPRLYAATAQYINNITGSGRLPNIGGIDFEQFAPVFNTLLFSPRLMAARINMLNPYYFATLPTPLKIQYGKDMGSFLGMASLLLTLFALYGKTQGDDEEKITVETDPTSTDFARIKQGETRWDLSGGFQPYIRLFNQIGAGERKSAKTGLKQSLDGEGAFGLTYGDVVLSFLRSKLSPIPAMTVDFMQGRNVVGERVTLKDEIFSHVIPLSMQSIIEAAKEGGPSKIISAGLPAIFGIGVQTYGERPREVKQEINYRNREIELTKEQVNYFQDTYNSLSTKNLEKLKNTKEYKGVSRETQVEMEKYVQKAAMQKAEKMLTTKYSKEFLKSPVIKKEPKEERAKESIKRQF